MTPNVENVTTCSNIFVFFTVLDLTLVDLPGLTKVNVGDQPDDIEQLVNYYNGHYYPDGFLNYS